MMVFSSKYQRNQVKLTKMIQNCFPSLLQYIGTFILSLLKVVFVLSFLTATLGATKAGKAEVGSVPTAAAGAPWRRSLVGGVIKEPQETVGGVTAGPSVTWQPRLPSCLLVPVLLGPR